MLHHVQCICNRVYNVHHNVIIDFTCCVNLRVEISIFVRGPVNLDHEVDTHIWEVQARKLRAIRTHDSPKECVLIRVCVCVCVLCVHVFTCILYLNLRKQVHK